MLNSSESNNEADTSFLPHDYLARKADRRTDVVCLSLFTVVLFGVVSAFFVTNRQWSSRSSNAKCSKSKRHKCSPKRS
jgi:hypothetical protein